MIKDLGIIIAAAGTGSRFGDTDKLLENLSGLPVFLHSIRNFSGLCPQNNLLVAVHPEKLEQYRDTAQKYLPDLTPRFVAGGKVRAESVMNALRELAPGTKFVAIHDAARPLADRALLEKCLEISRIHGGAIPAKPVVDTLKRTDKNGIVKATVSRENLWRVETPQVFNLAQLLDANRKCAGTQTEFTDDAAIMEAAGYEVVVLHNHADNTKITYPKDIETGF
jgi:2-C-methyl-D-erythritol 4-phosphate cytidylyltransferase